MISAFAAHIQYDVKLRRKFESSNSWQ